MTLEFKAKNIGIALCACIVLVALSTTFLHFLHPHHYTWPVDYPTKHEILYMFFGSCILAPIVEEAFFRYVPIAIIKTSPSYEQLKLPIIIGVSIFFGWMHGGEENILIQGFASLCFFWVYLKNGCSLISSILVHSLYNYVLFVHLVIFMPLY